MRITLTFTLALGATPAFAHIGHLAEVGGHGHWIALGGIAIAGAIALWGGRKKAEDDAEASDEDAEDTEEAPA
ncbi:MAG: DUF6732 family protein [Pseudomonadota bacterium]